MTAADIEAPKRARGTSNTNDRGNTRNRAARRAWLLSTYAADVPIVVTRYIGAPLDRPDLMQPEVWTFRDPSSSYARQQLLDLLDDDDTREYVVVEAVCRCYRCGRLLHDAVTLPSGFEVPATVTADRIRPGIDGGSYARTNIRPACGACNSSTGGTLGNVRKAAQARR